MLPFLHPDAAGILDGVMSELTATDFFPDPMVKLSDKRGRKGLRENNLRRGHGVAM
jgi:hypothetical protein